MIEKQNIEKLAELISKYAPHDGSFDLPSTNAWVVKRSNVDEISNFSIAEPTMCIVAKGAKRVSFGERTYEYDVSKIIVYSAEIPVATSIISGSSKEPYLCLVIPLDIKRLSDLSIKVFPKGLPKEPEASGIYLGENNDDIIGAAVRLIETISKPSEAEYIVPLIVDEILIRLLKGPFGASIAHMGVSDSNAFRVSKAITWLKDNYAEPIKIDDLADISSMSTSNFHRHFKNLTSMSPLQFQKIIRLQEAKRLMVSNMMDVSSACYEVGYSSVSQFSREYSRYFGSSPSKDVANLR